jgi:ATP-dependent helicase/nuclease subunit A
VPIYFPESKAHAKGLDRTMVRGRVDAMLLDGDEIVIADYKTDRISPSGVGERAKFYQPQLAKYREAIVAITGKNVRSASLVFLSAKAIHEI